MNEAEPIIEVSTDRSLNCPDDRHFAEGNIEETRPGISDGLGWRTVRRLRCLSCGSTRDYELESNPSVKMTR